MGYFLGPAQSLPTLIFKRVFTPTNSYPSPTAQPRLILHARKAARAQPSNVESATRAPKYASSVPRTSQQVFNRRDSRVNDWRTIAMEDRPACISIPDVQHAVARAFCLSISEMLSRKRRHRLTSARQVAMYLSRELAGGGWMGRRRQAASFPRIGMVFARDHTSVYPRLQRGRAPSPSRRRLRPAARSDRARAGRSGAQASASRLRRHAYADRNDHSMAPSVIASASSATRHPVACSESNAAVSIWNISASFRTFRGSPLGETGSGTDQQREPFRTAKGSGRGWRGAAGESKPGE
jgi:hypothetical protein